MEKQTEDQCLNTSAEQGSQQELFLALPPLSSEEYLNYVKTAPTEALPPEVLVRAFRQLPCGSAASHATLCRLFRRIPGQSNSDASWEYLDPTVSFARRHLRSIPGEDYEDAFQDALRRITETLAGPRGRFAEKSFQSYCRREMIDAYRQKYGRRGEWIPPEESIEPPEENVGGDPLSQLIETPEWHADLRPNQITLIEEIAQSVLVGLPSPFIQAVAREAWLQNERPKTSGSTRGPDGSGSLASRFPGKSRHQVLRALRHADAQLVAALMSDSVLELGPDLESLLKRLKARMTGRVRPAKRK
jgi:DNA-directed RNA polymerase specialized sigma24 family protein